MIHKPEKRPTLKQAQKMVGGMVELLTMPNGDQLLVNENGRSMELPPNLEATIYLQEQFESVGDTVKILGDAILLTGKTRWT